MKKLEELLRNNARVSDYKINVDEKKSYELFFVKGKLETVRSTNTCDTEVTVYAAHDDYLGDAQFFVYSSTTNEQLTALIEEAADKAMLICNKPYSLPAAECGEYEVESNFSQFRPEELAAVAANTVFDANTIENGSLNSVEVFVNRHRETVINSRGIHKTQVRYDAMVEAIPTYNGENQSVELYEQYNFSNLDQDAMYQEIARMMTAVKARYEAVKPEKIEPCKVILNKLELSELFGSIARNLHYSSVYSHSTMFHKGDSVQKQPDGDLINITVVGSMVGNIRSAKFDGDGISLGEQTIIADGKAVGYFGDNRFGQYLGEVPTGNLRCLNVAPGTVRPQEFSEGPFLEILSMSGLQVDFFSDYIGGEVRLAYYHDGRNVTPVTGISVSGSLGDVLNHIRLADAVAAHDGYVGPEKAILLNMKVF